MKVGKLKVWPKALSTHIRGRSHLWRELRNHFVTDGSSAIACAHDGDASSLLVTSSSNVIVASDDGISQEDPTHCANAASGVPDPLCLGIDPVCLGVPPCFTQNQVSETCKTASYNTNYQGRASHGSLLPANVHRSFPSRNVNRCVRQAIPSIVTYIFCQNVVISSPEMCSTQTEGTFSMQKCEKLFDDQPKMAKEQTHVGIFVIEHVDSGKSTTAEKMGVSVTRHGVLRRTRHGAFGMRKHWLFRRRKHWP
nr:hypothetical protein [Tanacetum cinerariifolium]